MGKLVIALAGNPNSGKTTVFNALTGAHQKVGNWPGVTVEKKEGEFSFRGNRIQVVDLPGTYSLTAYSEDERVAREFLLKGHPDVVVTIVDATNLERNLYLTLELLEMGMNVVADFNMMDSVSKKGWRIDVDKISKVLHAPVVPTVATTKERLDKLKDVILEVKGKETKSFKVDYGQDVEERLDKLTKMVDAQGFNKRLEVPSRWLAVKLLENDAQVKDWLKELPRADKVIRTADSMRRELEDILGEDVESYLIERRYGFLSGLVKEYVHKPRMWEKITLSDKMDKVVTNRWVGIPLFLFFMWIAFKLVFDVGGPIADYIDGFFGWLGDMTTHYLGKGLLSSFLANGIIGGVGAVLVFLPNIFILFLIIGFLEDCGYMARAAFVMDRFMHALGLHGKSFIPMILGFGCNIPGIMATRTLESKKDRLLTILVNPFMSCSARLPIYVLFAGTFFPKHAGTVIFSMYALGIVVAIISAVLFKHTLFKGEEAPFVMELPPNRLPTLKSILLHAWERSSIFLKKAGTIILAGVTLVWFLSSMPPGVEYASEKSWIADL